MNAATITMPKHEALTAYREYRQAVRENPNPRDEAIMMGYRAIASGKAVIDVAQAIREAGLDEKGRPKLAIGRADWPVCRFRYSAWPSAHLSFKSDSLSLRHELRIPAWEFGTPGISQSNWTAQTPMIPPRLRPAGNLKRYHILWEANWVAAPTDPYLLRHLDGFLYVVLAAWNLTPLERAAMGARITQ